MEDLTQQHTEIQAPARKEGGPTRGGMPMWLILSLVFAVALGLGGAVALASGGGSHASTAIQAANDSTVTTLAPTAPFVVASGGGSTSSGGGSSSSSKPPAPVVAKPVVVSFVPDKATQSCTVGGNALFTLMWDSTGATSATLQGPLHNGSGAPVTKKVGFDPKGSSIDFAPCVSGTVKFTLTVFNAKGASDSRDLQIVITAHLPVVSSPLPFPLPLPPAPKAKFVTINTITAAVHCNSQSSALVVFNYTTSGATSVKMNVSEPGKFPDNETGPVNGAMFASVPCPGVQTTVAIAFTPMNGSTAGVGYTFNDVVYP